MAVGFSLPVFFVIFRECTEASIIISVLLSFVKSKFRHDAGMQKTLSRSVWFGTVAGVVLSLAIGTAFLVILLKYATDLWAQAEAIWEGVFMLIACVLLTVMAYGFLKSDELTAKWEKKLHKKLDENAVQITSQPLNEGKTKAALEEAGSNAIFSFKSPLFWVPFVTVVREGLEGMIFLGGTAIGEEAGSIPLAAIIGLVCGGLIGYAIYRAGNSMKLHTFFVSASILLLYLAAGLLSKSVAMFEINTWNKAIGSMDSDDAVFYNIFTNVWHIECCNPEDKSQGGWQMFSAIFGWTNNATIGTVVSYILFWLTVSVALVVLKLKERKAARGNGAVGTFQAAH
ncbi:iron permease FTR1/Fip1/EfeU [Obelidium mucronatum]|nr:iron permease FTR1/Fip1/EfeU [Obelidium mucronatum]